MKDFEFMLAPMEDYTNPEFRELCFNNGADSTFTEMARVSALARNNKSTLEKISIPKPIPTYIQIIGANEHELENFLQHFKPEQGFLGFNLNLGCPSPQLIKVGLGCTLIKRVSKVNRLVSIVKNHGYSCSIKMRLGLNAFEKEKKTYLNLINGVDADFFVVHARHGMQHYESPADYSVFSECVETGKEIIANGDIDSKEKVDQLKSFGVKGIMIGRAAVRNPSIFEHLKGLKETNADVLRKEYSSLAEKYPSSFKYKDNVLKRLGFSQLPSDKKIVMG